MAETEKKTATKAADDKTTTTKEIAERFRNETSKTVVNDRSGEVSNRVEGTIQSEPTPEEFPPDAKIAPIAEQLNPNGAGQAVGAAPQPEEVAGVDQPKEGEKNLQPDMSDTADFLPEGSKDKESTTTSKK